MTSTIVDKIRTLPGLASSLALIGLLAPQIAAAANCGSVKQRMDALMNKSQENTTLVLAHRGVWGTMAGNIKVPENSLSAMYWADQRCVDGVEFDVKLTSDDVPMLMHDYTLGRTTNVWTVLRGGTPYNPIQNTGTNPYVSEMSYNSIRGLRLLSPDNRQVMQSVPLPSVNDLFDAILKYGYQIPVVFDVKDAASVAAIAARSRIAFGGSSPYYVAVKVNATLFPDPAQFTYGNIEVIPVYTTNMLAKINVLQSLDKWIRQYGAHTVEINVKQPNGLLARERRFAQTVGARVGVFQAIPDGPYPGQFYRNTGSCCYKLSDMYAEFNGTRDTADQRGDLNFIKSQGFRLVTTDRPFDVR